MKEEIEKVLEFHKAFHLYTTDKPPSIPKVREAKLRGRLIWEEAKELYDEIESGTYAPTNLDKIAKEICDVLIVTYGCILDYGLQDKIEEIFEAVHQANMSKLVDGAPLLREDGKVLKGPNYKPANVKAILEK